MNPLARIIQQSPIGRIYRMRHRIKSTRHIFTDAYRQNIWNSSESVSGTGSTHDATLSLRTQLPTLIERFNIKTMLDAPCGDFHWLSEVNLPARYIGVDIVGELIERNKEKYPGREFRVLDIMQDDLPSVDLIFCRDALVHFTFRHVLKTLRNFQRSRSRYLLTTTFTSHPNLDLDFTGLWRPLNLQAPPFNFPPPLHLINEECPEMDGIYADKCQGLWELSSLVLE